MTRPARDQGAVMAPRAYLTAATDPGADAGATAGGRTTPMWIVLIILAVLLVLALLMYNSLISKKNQVENALPAPTCC